MRYGLYIHIPFCLQKCFYCDFPSFAGQAKWQIRYVAALKREIEIRKTVLNSADFIDTVYFGGGTPTILTDDLLIEILDSVRDGFAIAQNAEITLEANPGTVDESKLLRLYSRGFNRISFGVQSFQDELLKGIGRIHTAAEAESAVIGARNAGFENISIDLMYGLPKQTSADLAYSVEQALALEVQHISVYGLKVEAGTKFAEWQAAGMLPLPDEDTEDAMYTYIMRELPQRGYERYEISNFAQNGFGSRHNIKYWKNQPYIGLGAAAHSCYFGERFANISGLTEYIESVENEREVSFSTEILTREMLMEEFCFLGLRLKEGISAVEFAARFQCNIFMVYGDIINRLCEKQLLRHEEGRIYLTERGMKYGNNVFCEFLLN